MLFTCVCLPFTDSYQEERNYISLRVYVCTQTHSTAIFAQQLYLTSRATDVFNVASVQNIIQIIPLFVSLCVLVFSVWDVRIVHDVLTVNNGHIWHMTPTTHVGGGKRWYHKLSDLFVLIITLFFFQGLNNSEYYNN